MFEITILVGACFIVNYVTADAKTNWAEGMMMVAFYVMIVCVLDISGKGAYIVTGAHCVVVQRSTRDRIPIAMCRSQGKVKIYMPHLYLFY